MANDVNQLYVTALRNTHAEETQGLQQMERQVERLENYPQYAALLRRHISTTQGQVQRLEQALEAQGETISALKETVTGLAGNIGAAVHALAGDETLKNLYAGYAYQYHQIAAYKSLIEIAKAAGATAHVSLFEKSLQEETEAANEVERLIAPVTQKYVQLYQSQGTSTAKS